MVTTVVDLDLVPLLLFFLYSVLEVFIAGTTEDYRFIEIEEESEVEEEEEEDYYEQPEYGGNLIQERMVLPGNSNFIFNAAEEDDHEEEEEEEEDYEEGEEGEELIPGARMLPRRLIEEEDYEDEEVEELISPRVSGSISYVRTWQGAVSGNGLLGDSNDSESCGGKPGNQENCGGDRRKEELSRGEIDGFLCPICFETWTSGGKHQICCLPCGHIYGLSCIKKWLQQRRSSGKCPQCNSLCTLKDVRVLYATRLCAADGELQKRVRSLEAKCAYLGQKVSSLAAPVTPEEFIDQICNNPKLIQRLTTLLTE